MVTVNYDGEELTYQKGVWSGDDPSIVHLLNTVTASVAASYLSDEANARRVLEQAIGAAGWEIISADPEPPDPGVVY